MENTFATSIQVGKVRHLENVTIKISDTQSKHLILTGKNGSGKTSLLEAMRDSILYQQKRITPDGKALAGFVTDQNPNINISYSQHIPNFSNFIFVYIPTVRSKLDVPTAIEKINNENKAKVDQNASELPTTLKGRGFELVEAGSPD